MLITFNFTTLKFFLQLGSLISIELTSVPSSTPVFLDTLLSRLESAPNARVHIELLRAAEKSLTTLATKDESVSGAAQFVGLYITSQLLMNKVLEDKLWYSSAVKGNNIKTSISLLLQNCLK